jgi:hypothetical protein
MTIIYDFDYHAKASENPGAFCFWTMDHGPQTMAA